MADCIYSRTSSAVTAWVSAISSVGSALLPPWRISLSSQELMALSESVTERSELITAKRAFSISSSVKLPAQTSSSWWRISTSAFSWLTDSMPQSTSI